MSKYDSGKIEKKWQKVWDTKKPYKAVDGKGEKFYALMEFPYPSGDGLHTGHVRGYTAMDIIARKKRMQGFNVMFPIGWDAFGLPTENYAIKTGIAPEKVTKQNTDNFRKQFKSLGMSFDWSREVNTTDPKYYKWTQWIFLQLLKHGLAYKAKSEINWCPKDKIGLANEEVVDGKCERCGTPVEKREKEQWMLAITKYAERLHDDLEMLDYPDRVKIQQRNWIGKSEGAEIVFPIAGNSVSSYVLLHGYTGSPEANFFPWLKKELEKTGAKVYCPKLPNSDDPIVMSQTEYVLKNIPFDENTVLIGHSLGGVVALKVLEKLSKPIKKTILVGCYAENRFLDEDFPARAFDWKFNADKIKVNSGAITLLRDLSDNTVPQDNTFALHKLVGGQLFDYTAQEPHFCGKTEPEVLQHCVDGIKVFTTRPDTIFGATYMVLAPEHELVKKLAITNKDEVEDYITQSRKKTEIERTTTGKQKTGIELKGVRAINPANNEEIQIWIADYVLPHYGTGAIMAVPAHDERDWDFANKYNLPIKQVITPVFVDKTNAPKDGAENTVRSTVIILIKHWSENKYLINYSPKFSWKCLFTGGVEEGEDPLDSAVREMKEETGYQNVKEVRYIPLEHIDKFHAPHKGVNRVCYQKNVFIQLADGEQKEVAPEEKELHHLSWHTEKEMKEIMTLPNHVFVFETELAKNKAILENGVLMNSGQFNGLDSEQAKAEIIKFVGGLKKTSFKLRDWVFSRQRYWGEPIPVIHCDKCGTVPVPEKDLPVKLPKVKKYTYTETGESPLASVSSWVNVKCPKCKGPAKRETDTMPNWAGSSWYFLRYVDPKNSKEFASEKLLKNWMPVDWYNGGMEHTTLHLLYSRFWNKFLYDQKLVPTSEPYKKRTSHGLILAEGGVKMSKSLGNVINPDGIVKTYGADTLRLYEMFMGPFEQAVAWSSDSIIGPRRFLERVFALVDKVVSDGKLIDQNILEKTIEKVGNDIEEMSLNTAISQLMICANSLEKEKEIPQKDFARFLQVLAPFAPHIAEELWMKIKMKGSVHGSEWPEAEKVSVGENIKIAVQINGRIRGTVQINLNDSEEKIREVIESNPEFKKYITGPIMKFIYVKGRVASLVI